MNRQQNSLTQKNVSREKRDQVLSEMFEMFLDAVDAEIIESVVQSCHYNSLRAMEALMSISSHDDPSKKQRPEKNVKFNAPKDNVSGLDAISLAYANEDDVIVEIESEVQISENVLPNSSSVQLVKPASDNAVQNGDLTSSQIFTNPACIDSYKSCPGSYTIPRHSNHNSSYSFKSSVRNIQWHIENGMKILILMRGCPGSGKSFLARQIIEEIGGDLYEHILSTDDFFIHLGEYNFQASRLSEAHIWNQKRALSAVRSEISPIIIDNTHTQMWEMDVYVQMALVNGYSIEILEPQTSWFFSARELYRRNSHSIPYDKIELMLNRYEGNITVNLLKERAEKYLKCKTNTPQRALRPVGLNVGTDGTISNCEVLKPFKIQNLWKTGEVKKIHTDSISPSVPNPHIPHLHSENEKEQSLISPLVDFSSSDSCSHEICSTEMVYKNISKDIITSEDFLPISNTNSNIPSENLIELSSNPCGSSEKSPDKLANSDLKTIDCSIVIVQEHAVDTQNNFDTSNVEHNNHHSSSCKTEELVEIPKDSDVYISSEDEELPENCVLLLTEQSDSDIKNLAATPLCAHSPAPQGASKAAQSLEKHQEGTLNLDVNSNTQVESECGNSSLNKASLGCFPSEVAQHEEPCKDSSEVAQNDNACEDSTYPVIPGGACQTEMLSSCESVPLSVHHCQTPPKSPNRTDMFENSDPSTELCRPEKAETFEILDFLPQGSCELPKSVGSSDHTNILRLGAASLNTALPEFPNDSWIGQSSWDDEKGSPSDETKEDSIEPKPPRSPRVRKHSCTSTLAAVPAASNLDEKINWAFCASGSVSWQTIDKNQEEFYGKFKPSAEDVSHLQRAKFSSNKTIERKVDCVDKETMTHHSDFSLVNSLSPSSSETGVKVLVPNNRDINFGIVNVERKTLKLMLHKSTSTENEFSLSDEREGCDKLVELTRLFPNVSKASLVELLDRCQGDVDWVSNLLLDTDSEVFASAFFQDTSNPGFLDDEQNTSSSPICSENLVSESNTSLVQKGDFPKSEEFLEQAKEIKKHLENSITISDESYSPHVLSIRNFRKNLREGGTLKHPQSVPSTSYIETAELDKGYENIPGKQDFSVEAVKTKSEDGSEEDDDDSDFLELIFGQDLVQQLLDKFGGVYNTKKLSPVVKIPHSLARHLHYYILTSQENQQNVEESSLRSQYEEDERIARQLFEDMQKTRQSEPSQPQLQEIMDFQMAEAIYRADLNALNRNSEETVATVLAKRLLQESFPNIDSKVLNDMLQAHNNSFEDTVKVLRLSLTNDNAVFSASGREKRENDLMEQAKKASLLVSSQHLNSSSVLSSKNDEKCDAGDAMVDASAFREKAALLQEQRKECYLKARDAFQRKERSVAAYYAQLANCHRKNIDQAHARAAAALAEASFMSRAPDTLDLHYLRVAEAVQVLDVFLDHHISSLTDSASGKTYLYIITGRGARSVDGKARIRLAVIKRTKERNLEYTLENPGLLKISISRYSPLSSCRGNNFTM